MKILITGQHGQVSQELQQRLKGLGELLVLGRDQLDLADADLIRQQVRAHRPGLIINAAAHTAVDLAESEPDAAFAINAIAPGILAEEAKALGIPLIHYSTDYVFDGQGSRPYREDDPTAPLGVYGASKLAGEDAIRAAGGRHLILRTAWVYGQHGHNFMKTMLRLGADRDKLRVVADQVGTPTPAALIADVTTELLGLRDAPSGTFHLTPRGETSWHGFAEAILEEALARGLISRAPKVIPVATSDYPTRARRPGYSRLDIGRLEQVLGRALPEWRTGLRQVLGS